MVDHYNGVGVSVQGTPTKHFHESFQFILLE